ncbi:guanylate cyclase soluble subunit beta-2-like isoform X2 [Babylonia areolata]|uniref:guanylate cyclase soluble subunit beta-2-like isoform X2 n=1 Tax=Babylonia areolata TaxID=304850 RepID=UPI003FD11498
MYGQIHCIIRELVLEKYGQEAWQTILKKSGLDVHQHFLVFSRYTDDITLKLVAAVSDTLDVPVEGVLQVFGAFFLTYCLRHGYDKMLKTLGWDIASFIQNLDSLHSLLALSYKGILAPSFRCEEKEDGDLILHYYSTREGLYPIVIGLVEAVAQELFSQTVTLTVVSRTQEETSARVIQHHTVFEVHLQDGRAESSGRQESWALTRPTPTGGDRGTPDGQECSSVLNGSCVDQSPPLHPAASSSLVQWFRADDFCSAFPYHLVMDEDLRILQCGDSIRRITNMPVVKGMPFQEVGNIVQPMMDMTLDNILKFINAVFLLAFKRRPSSGARPFLLKGQIMWLHNSRSLLFIGSPRLTSLNELLEMNLYLADIPLYDCTRELVLLNQQRIAEIDVAKKLDETTVALQKTSQALAREKQKTEDLLHEMLPEKVARQLTQGIAVSAEKFECVTILFSDIVSFTNIASACTPMDIVSMLNDLFHCFDSRTNAHDVYKVETIGDAYMAVAGVPEAQADHAERVANFAMDMIVEANNVTSPATGRPLQIRVGMHSGPVVAGVVGKKMPRYCLFGDTVNTASRMESHGMPGRVHLSEATFRLLYDYGYMFKRRGKIEVKGKGQMVTYFLVGHLQRPLPQPSDSFTQLSDLVSSKPIIRPCPSPKAKSKTRQSFNFFKKSSLKGAKEKEPPISPGADNPNSSSHSSHHNVTHVVKDQKKRNKSNFCLIG